LLLGEGDQRAADAGAALIGPRDQDPELAGAVGDVVDADASRDLAVTSGDRDLLRPDQLGELGRRRAPEPVAPEAAFGDRVDLVDEASQMIDQPGVVADRRLEQELGITLFERTSRRVTPTEAGEAIAARARRVLAEVDGARAEVDELRGVLRGRIWIGPLVPAGDVDVPGLLARFSQAHPGVEVGVREGIAADMLRLLAADELDAAFCPLAGDIPTSSPSSRSATTRRSPRSPPAAPPSAPYVGVADLARHQLVAPRRGSAITTALEQRFADAGEPLRLTLESGDPFLLRALAARGFATAILPRSLAALDGPAVEVRSLDPAVELPVALVWRRDRNVTPAARSSSSSSATRRRSPDSGGSGVRGEEARERVDVVGPVVALVVDAVAGAGDAGDLHVGVRDGQALGVARREG
jgi:DNA-binding transcriptional LysR family regulator